ncbi:MAG TPA: ESX secretion-associated protein EspG [Amycolatopsis sp.]|nr:ESX secretion-associated protein EspG [Amycolatopsis sp.]
MIEISASAFDIVWDDLGGAPVPPPLDVPSVGATERERAEIRSAVYGNLAGRGLFDGRLDPVLAERLEILAGAQVYVECEGLVDGRLLRAVAAAGGKRGVLAAQPSRTIGLSPIRVTEVFAAVVDLLPWEPGPGYGVTLPAAVLRGDVEDPVFGNGRGSAAYEQQIREVLAIEARPVLAAGHFSVRVRDAGRLRRAGGVSWFRTDVGTYFGSVAPGRGGQDWVTVAPADCARVAARLAEFVA